MLIRRDRAGVVVRAPAKVNLFLEVLRRRPDGYHELETLMVAVRLMDTLVLEEEPSGSIALQCDHPDLSSGPDNLVWRAAELLRQRTGYRGGARIRLYKRIPMQAGLGGGSSDAAAVLAGLSSLWKLGLPRQQLVSLGAEIGSDVPFFFSGPSAWCTGRGEQMELLPASKPLWLVLVCPAVGLSTADVFRKVIIPDRPLSGEPIRHALQMGDAEAVGRCLHNRLQPLAEALCPEVVRLHHQLLRLNPAGALMSGSGTALLALGRSSADALRIARGLASAREEHAGLRVYLVRSCD